MDYLDFDLEIGEEQNGEYPVRVLDSPGGQAVGVFKLPFSGMMLDLQLEKLQTALLRSGGKHRLVLSEEEQTVQEFGQELFSGLIAEDIRARYAASLTRASDQRLGLRVKLRIRDPKLAALPWEFLYDPDRGDYVCLSDETPIVRYLDLPRPPRVLEIRPPLRVLGMIASPQNLPPLDIERERERIRLALGPLQAKGLVELEWVDGQNWRDLQQAMWQGPWHIFHFIGHGRFDSGRDEGQIALTGADGYSRLLPATGLGRLLARERSLRLAVLNACQGAHSAGHDIFSSTASILVRRGLPAVVAMQYEITDAAAIEFARTFYRAMASGVPVDAAVTDARNAISVAINNTVEWGTPVLFMRSPDGTLFDVTGTPVPVEVQPEADAGQEERLGALYLQANSAYWSEDYERAVEIFRQIIELNPDYSDSAAKLAQAEGRLKAARLYADARAAVEREAWAEAEGFLRELVELDADYADAAELLSDVQHCRELAELVAQAQDLYRHEQWRAVVNIFEQIEALEPDYPDPDGLLAGAQKALQEQAELKRLAELYAAGLAAMDAGEWARAIDRFEQIEKSRPDYEDTTLLLVRAREELAKMEGKLKAARLYEQGREAVRAKSWQEARTILQELTGLDPDYEDAAALLSDVQHHLDLTELEAQAQAFYQQAKWQDVISIFEQIRELFPDYDDPDGLLSGAQQALREQRRLAELYAKGSAALDAGEWAAAIKSFAKIVKVRPDYEDTPVLLARARAELAREQQEAEPEPPVQETATAAEAAPAGVRPAAQQAAKPARSSARGQLQQLPRWAWIAGGVVGLVVIFGIISGVANWAGSLFSAGAPLPAIRTSVPAPTGLPLALTGNNESPMVVIPAGSFEMGMDPDAALEYCQQLYEPFVGDECARDWYLDEHPVHTFFLDDYYMDQYEVTNQQFAVFLNERGNQSEGGATWLDAADEHVKIIEAGRVWAVQGGFGDHPVVEVTWYGAKAYCEWRGARLPTEAEWEKAARGDAGQVYPWGDAFDGDLANFCDANCNLDWSNPNYDDGYAGTAPVGSYRGGVSPHGLYDMAGNVWEWVADWYGEDYYSTLKGGVENPTGPETGDYRVLRGGSGSDNGALLRAAFRSGINPSVSNHLRGFRCARSP